MDRLSRFFSSFIGSLTLILTLAAYRKLFTFSQICGTSGNTPTPGLEVCPSFLEVFSLTLISPIGLTVLILGTPLIYLLLNKIFSRN